MQLNIDDLSEEQMRVFYTIGRMGSPTRSDISSLLAKANISSEMRKRIISQFVLADLMVVIRDPGIGKKGANVIKYELTHKGHYLYKERFNRPAATTHFK